MFRLYCAVMIEVYVLINLFIYLLVSVIPILCAMCGSE